MLDQLLKPQAQHSSVADAAALQRSGLPALLRDALQAAFNKSQAGPRSQLDPDVAGRQCTHGMCRQSIGVTAQVAAVAESVVGREPFALVQVWPAALPCIVACRAKPALPLVAPLQLGRAARSCACMCRAPQAQAKPPAPLALFLHLSPEQRPVIRLAVRHHRWMPTCQLCRYFDSRCFVECADVLPVLCHIGTCPEGTRRHACRLWKACLRGMLEDLR